MTPVAGPATPADGAWGAWMEGRLSRVREEGRWRVPRVFDALGPEGTVVEEGRRVVSFASNDYLGLTAHPDVIAAAGRALERWGAGAGGSRLVTGTRPVHRDLEEALAAWKGTEAAVSFPTGFAANLAVLAVLGAEGTRILSDELNHASIVDGCRMARAPVSVYRHADPEHLAALLGESTVPAVVVTDTVFSMDGDVAPLAELASVCRRHGALLVLDEAHAVLGPEPGELVGDDLPVVRVGTMSKTLGSLGGFVAGSRRVVDLLVNLARPYIFTTAPSPADAAAALAAVEVVRGPDGAARRARLAELVERVAPGHPSPIVPVVLGAEERALAASASLLDAGLWVPAIRPPTVPVGTSRLRVTLSALHGDDDVARLVAALDGITGPEMSGLRPDRLVAVVGTGTDVGKTWVSARLLAGLRAEGCRVWARKPAQSFEREDDPAATDAAVLAGATGEDRFDVCPPERWLPVAMAPPMAAEVLGRPAFTVADLVDGIRWPRDPSPGGGPSVGLVETAGGVRSPQAADGDAVDLVRRLAPDVVVLVAHAGLGTINDVRLCAGALAAVCSPRPAPGTPGPAGPGPRDGRAALVVVLNRFDPDRDLHRRNRRWLAERDGVAALVTPGEEGSLRRAVLG